MVQPSNPYEPPREQSTIHAESVKKVSDASIFWFVGAVFLVTYVSTFSQPTLSTQPFRPTLGSIVTVSLISAVSTIVSSIVYGFVAIIFKRSCPATRTSRILAGVVFACIMFGGMLLVIIVGFKGPPAIISLPVAAIASTVVDRYLASARVKDSEVKTGV